MEVTHCPSCLLLARACGVNDCPVIMYARALVHTQCVCLQVLAVVSQASVAFVFFFAFVVAAICFSPVHNAGALWAAVIWSSLRSPCLS